jgi:crotonobetainyl-CoA:carnitine CoA-transferase CaiB-like acyl-CoA transferase
VIRLRAGNRRAGAVPHGAFPCADEDGVRDRWVAIACQDDADWEMLAPIIGADDPSLATVAARTEREDEVEALVGAWTQERTRAEVAALLQATGLEAVPVEDFGDLHEDPQLAARGHFETHEHPFLGVGLYERNGFRLSDSASGYDRAGPTLGQDTEWVLGDVLGLDADAIAALRASGAVE